MKYIMKAMAEITSQVLLAMRLRGSNPLWQLWNGRSVTDGWSMRYWLNRPARQGDE